MTQLTSESFCSNHPQQITHLRCNRCGCYICPKCAIKTPTGYRCKDCIKNQQKVFENTEWYDYPVSFIAGCGLSFFGSLIASRLGFFVIFLAPIAGGIVSEIIRAIIRRRRSKLLFQVTAGAVALGSLPHLIIALITLNLGSLLWTGIYTFLITSTVYYRMSGIKIG